MKTEMQKETTENLFKQTVSQIKNAKSIDVITDAVISHSELASRLLQGDISKRILKQECRRLMKSVKDEYGFPLFMSVKKVDEQGNTVREYKQPRLFVDADFEQTIDYYGQLTVHYAKTTIELQKRCRIQLGKQIPLPFDERSILLD